MVVRLDDAKVRVTLEIDKLSRDLDRVDKERDRSKKQREKDEGRRQERLAQPTRERKVAPTKSTIGRAAAGVGRLAGIALLIDQIIGPVTQGVLKGIGENVDSIPGLKNLENWINKIPGQDVDFSEAVKDIVEDVIAPFLDQINVLRTGLDKALAGIQAAQETADFARNAGLLGRLPGGNRLFEIGGETYKIRHAQLSFQRYVGRETREQIFHNLTNWAFNGFSKQ